MMHKKNKGVTMVEVLIALAIFMIMMIPLVSSIVAGMRTSTTAKETQNRNEYTRNLMESVKEVPMSILDDPTAARKFFEDMGSENVTVTPTNATYTGTVGSADYSTYNITGTTYVGVEHVKYDYSVDISNYDYAVAEAEGLYVDPNNLTSTYVESLDQSKIAFISAPYANHDTPAFDALLTEKLTKVREQHEASGTIFDPEVAVDSFKYDRGRRNIQIKVTGNAGDGYDVVCTLKYSDDSAIGQTIGTMDYTPYTKHFTRLPNIYLMYNVCVYNGQYSDDYITFDVSGMADADEVKVFVIATADEANGNTLYKTDIYGSARDGAVIGFGEESNTGKVKVYHNFNPGGTSPNGGSNKLNVTAVDGTNGMNDLFDVNYQSVDVATYEDVQKDRSLYEITIRMQEATGDVNDLLNSDPILRGARGGDEID